MDEASAGAADPLADDTVTGACVVEAPAAVVVVAVVAVGELAAVLAVTVTLAFSCKPPEMSPSSRSSRSVSS